MSHLEIGKADLIYSNEIAKKNNWPRHLTQLDIEDEVKPMEEEQTWPIHYSIKMRPERWRILFEHCNGELYQLDIPDEVYNRLTLRLEKGTKH